MTKQMYERLVLYREPRKRDPEDELLSKVGYLKPDYRTDAVFFCLSEKAIIEMAEYEEKMRDAARQSKVNWTLIIIGVLTLIVTVLGLLSRCP